MTEISAEQRQKAKTAAANIAVGANDFAVGFGAAGLIVTSAGVFSVVGAFVGVDAGVLLGLCSFGAWWIGNRYQRLANDPPRDDFDQVTVSAASINDAAIPADEPNATAARFAAQQLILADALSCLVTSLERFDGAQAAGDAAAASAQADAAQQNASAALAAQQALRSLADPLNQAWSATIPTVDWNVGDISAAQQGFQDVIGDPAAQAPGSGLQATLDAISGLTDPDGFADADLASHPLMTASEMPPEPGALASSDYLDALDAESDPFSSLAVPDSA